ncbi:unnamed protein product [Didymodactylos carnosus]|uniref:Uncharacterized protein n=1 Tax=Didymodactylos carnosus TaxID=1234261 RepID=A0A813V9W5_9BILA|nr:unnamed protein product [Didymodactylos carnosus]CAF0835142.1 unnamed protein product [Didymodactylos carnosus]CAF3520132.1 unnamed protein product [Didymodactylos carnosus]CAF3622307.1 unnamed protein product [Didymodactylos carnosus]
MVISMSRESNLSEALIQCKKLEKNFIKREYTLIDKERQKIRSSIDRHMETFLALNKKRHENWWKHDRHFREYVRKEKEKFRKPLKTESFNRPQTPFKMLEINHANLFDSSETESIVLPTITDTVILKPMINNNQIRKKRENRLSSATPISKVERRVQQVLKSSQKLLAESAAKNSREKRLKPKPLFSSSSFSLQSSGVLSNSTMRTTSSSITSPPVGGYHYRPIPPIDDDYYQKLLQQSIQRETYDEFIDHFVKFRPEFREKFSYIHEDMKRNIAIGKLRNFNNVQAKTKDERYHQLISSLSDFSSNESLSRRK